MARPKFVQARKTTLKVGISTTETGEIILKRVEDAYGNPLDMADFGDTIMLTFNPGASNEEIITATDFTRQSDGSVIIDTGIGRGCLASAPYTASGVGTLHSPGEVVVISNNPQMYEAILDYIDQIAIIGASPADDSVIGLTEVATTAEIDADTRTGSTTGVLSVSPDKLALSKYGLRLPTALQKQAMGVAGDYGAPSENNPFLTNQSINSVVFNYYGNGSDGDVTISAPTTLTRDMYYNNLEVNSVLTTNGYLIFVKETISGTGTIDFAVPNNGSNGSNGVVTAGVGAANGNGASETGAGRFKGRAGANGNALVPAGGLGNASGHGGQGGGVSATPVPTNAVSIPLLMNKGVTLAFGFDITPTGTVAPYLGPAGGQGGSQGQTTSQSGGGNPGGAGGAGGGGSAGGIVLICAKNWAGSFTIKSIGGNGGNAGTSANGFYLIGESCGGGGGAGGVSIVICSVKTWTGTYNLAGGTPGTRGGGSYDSARVADATAGATGASFELIV